MTVLRPLLNCKIEMNGKPYTPTDAKMEYLVALFTGDGKSLYMEHMQSLLPTWSEEKIEERLKGITIEEPAIKKSRC
jgi:hypothetical protein